MQSLAHKASIKYSVWVFYIYFQMKKEVEMLNKLSVSDEDHGTPAVQEGCELRPVPCRSLCCFH